MPLKKLAILHGTKLTEPFRDPMPDSKVANDNKRADCSGLKDHE